MPLLLYPVPHCWQVYRPLARALALDRRSEYQRSWSAPSWQPPGAANAFAGTRPNTLGCIPGLRRTGELRNSRDADCLSSHSHRKRRLAGRAPLLPPRLLGGQFADWVQAEGSFIEAILDSRCRSSAALIVPQMQRAVNHSVHGPHGCCMVNENKTSDFCCPYGMSLMQAGSLRSKDANLVDEKSEVSPGSWGVESGAARLLCQLCHCATMPAGAMVGGDDVNCMFPMISLDLVRACPASISRVPCDLPPSWREDRGLAPHMRAGLGQGL